MKKYSICATLLLLAACGGGGGSASSSAPSPLPPVTPLAELALFAGSAGGAGNLDGTGTAARFNVPTSLARDQDGNIYVADSANHTIRKISARGVVSTFAGAAGVPGYADGNGAAARFYHPTGLTVDRSGNVYVADDLNDVIRKITPAGAVSTLAGTAEKKGFRDGQGAQAQLDLCDQDDIGCSTPGMAIDSAGNLYLADLGNRAIRKITPAGIVSTLPLTECSYPLPNGSDAKCFNKLSGLAIDDQDRLFVADGPRVRLLSAAGQLSTFAGSTAYGDLDGRGVNARFNNIAGLSFAGGQLLVVEGTRVRTISATGQVSALSKMFSEPGYADGTENDARFALLDAATADSNGNVYVSDRGNHAIRQISPARSVSTFAGLGNYRGSRNLADGSVRFDKPAGIAIDRNNNIYVADFGAGNVQKITAAGHASRFAQNNFISGTALPSPQGLAVDKDGVLYVTDTTLNDVLRILPDGRVSTLALSFTDSPQSGSLFVPRGIAAAADGSLYLAETGKSLIRKISPAGQVSTVAGGTDSSKFNLPNGIAIDTKGNLFVADSYNHTIRKIGTDGSVSTFAGLPGQPGSTDGPGQQARFNTPQSLAFDGSGNLYVADTYNETIRKITPAGNVSTVAGVPGERGFIGGQLPGRLPHPYALAVSNNNLYITIDGGVAVIRNLP